MRFCWILLGIVRSDGGERGILFAPFSITLVINTKSCFSCSWTGFGSLPSYSFMMIHDGLYG
jgi:hypothetical protein